MRDYTQLTQEERYQIESLLKMVKSIRAQLGSALNSATVTCRVRPSGWI